MKISEKLIILQKIDTKNTDDTDNLILSNFEDDFPL